jgi:hypothetical protein
MSSLDPEYWCISVEHAMYVRNRVPTSALPFDTENNHPVSKATTPYKRYTGRLPDLAKLVVFGCRASPKIPKEKYPGKTRPRVLVDHICVGMEGSKIYKLLNLHSNKVILTADAGIDEYSFPFSAYKAKLQSIATAGNQLAKEISVETGDMSIESSQLSAVEERPTVTVEERPTGIHTVEGTATKNSIPHAEHTHAKLTRSGRWLYVYNDTIVQSITAFKALHLEDDDTVSLGAPTAPFEAIELDAAMREDAPGWRKSIHEELQALLDMNTFDIRRGRIPQGRQVLPCRLVLKKKFNTRGEIIRLKSRLCVRGDKQKPGIDYFETFASVVRYDTLRFLLAKVAEEDLELEHIDVDTAFLNPELKEEIYMQIPQFLEELVPELKGLTDAYIKLNKALYGLKQAPREWFKLVKKFF